MNNEEKALKAIKALIDHDKEDYVDEFINDINSRTLEDIKKEAITAMNVFNTATEEIMQKVPITTIAVYTASYTSMRVYTLIMALKEEGYQIYNNIGAIKNNKKEDILQYIKKNGKITVSYQTLSVLFNMARPNIITLLQELENDGLISIEKNNVEGANTPNTYIYKELKETEHKEG